MCASLHCIMTAQLTIAGQRPCRCCLSVTAACVVAALLAIVAALPHIAPSAVAAKSTWGTAPAPEHRQEARVLDRQEVCQPPVSPPRTRAVVTGTSREARSRSRFCKYFDVLEPQFCTSSPGCLGCPCIRLKSVIVLWAVHHLPSFWLVPHSGLYYRLLLRL